MTARYQGNPRRHRCGLRKCRAWALAWRQYRQAGKKAPTRLPRTDRSQGPETTLQSLPWLSTRGTAHFMRRSRRPASFTSMKVLPLPHRLMSLTTSSSWVGVAPLAASTRRSVSSSWTVSHGLTKVLQSGARQWMLQPERCRKLIKMRIGSVCHGACCNFKRQSATLKSLFRTPGRANPNVPSGVAFPAWVHL
jgi:hypothetical protein